MNEGSSKEDHEIKAKDTISWNIAISQASLNIFSMEANSAIAQRKKEINHLHRLYLAGKAQMESQFGDPGFDDEVWKQKTAEALSKNKSIHEGNMKVMIDSYEKQISELKKNISESEQKCKEYQDDINKANLLLKQRVPEFDFNVVGDLNELRRAIEIENQKIESIKSQESYNSNYH